MEWVTTKSDVEGCIQLHSPAVLSPKVLLNSPKVPVLCLIDALLDKSFAPVFHTLEHKPNGPDVFDRRACMSKRWYYQCLLSQTILFQRGVTSFKSNESSAFYRLLLHSRSPVPRGLSAKECKKRLGGLTDDVSSCALGDIVPPPVKKRKVTRPVFANDDSPCPGGSTDEECIKADVAVAPMDEASVAASSSSRNVVKTKASSSTGNDPVAPPPFDPGRWQLCRRKRCAPKTTRPAGRTKACSSWWC